MPRRGPTIASSALAILHDRGPAAIDELAAEIQARGLTRALDPRRAVAAALSVRYDVLRDSEGRYGSLVDQLDGAIFACRLTAFERQAGIVMLSADLHLLERLLIHPRPHVGGGEVHLDWLHDFFDLPWPGFGAAWEDGEVEPVEIDATVARDLVGYLRELGVPDQIGDDQALAELLVAGRDLRLVHGPADWMPAVSPAQLLGIRIRAGAVETAALVAADLRGPHVARVAAAVAALARRVIGPDASGFGPPAIELPELLELVAMEAPDLLRRPLPPFSEVVRASGLEVVDGLVGHPGTDWQAVTSLPTTSDQEAWGFNPSIVPH